METTRTTRKPQVTRAVHAIHVCRTPKTHPIPPIPQATRIKKMLCLGFFVSLLMICLTFLTFAEEEDNGDIGTANPIALNGSQSGNITNDGDDWDYYYFELTEDGVVTLSFSVPQKSNSSKAWKIIVTDSVNHEFLSVDVYEKNDGYVSPLLGLSKGKYYVIVKPYSVPKWSNAQYTLSLKFEKSDVWEKEYNGAKNYATEIESDMEYHGTVMKKKDEDYYKFQYAAESNAELFFSHAVGDSEEIYWVVNVWNSQEVVKSVEISLNTADITLSLDGLEEGTYYIVVTSDENQYLSSEYILSVKTVHVCEKEQVDAKTSTCEVAGNIAYAHCAVCGKYYDSQGNEINSTEVALPLAAHSFGELDEVTVEATCSAKGERKKICSVCGEEELEEIEALGHSLSTEWTVDVEPTCVSQGSKSHHCTRCDHKGDVTPVSATGHDFTNGRTERNEPTCTATGEQHTYCVIIGCDGYKTEELPALGHDYNTEPTVDQTATCKQEGSKSYHCTRCDSKTGITVIEKLEHPYGNWNVIESPTCTAEGEKSRACLSCGAVETEVLEKLEHTYDTTYTIDQKATCDMDGSKSRHCADCSATTDAQVIDALGHAYGEWQTSVYATCKEGGVKRRVCGRCTAYEVQRTDPLGHEYQTQWTVDTPATCTIIGFQSHHCNRCGEKTNVTEIPMRGHSYNCEYDLDFHKLVCANCGDTKDVEEHSLYSAEIKESTCL